MAESVVVAAIVLVTEVPIVSDQPTCATSLVLYDWATERTRSAGAMGCPSSVCSVLGYVVASPTDDGTCKTGRSPSAAARPL